jgi:hypothetical protein
MTYFKTQGATSEIAVATRIQASPATNDRLVRRIYGRRRASARIMEAV